MPFFIAIMVLVGAAYYFTTPQEQARFVRAVSRGTRQVVELAVRRRPARGPFDEALHERGRWLVATPLLVALNVGIFVCMLFAPGALSDPETLIGWGASVGPRTTNGEWSRLVTSLFVHTSFLHLLINVAALVQVGSSMERIFGRFAFASVYVSAGVISSIVSVAMHPVAVSTGATASLWGVLGLFVAWLIAGAVFRSPLTVPLKTALMASPAIAAFVLYSMAVGFDGVPDMAGLAIGVLYAVVLAKDAHLRKPPLLRLGAAMGAIGLLAVPSAFPLRGLTDVRPELARVAAVEQRTATVYDGAVHQFTRGEIPVGRLADLIQGTILPELQAAHARLNGLRRVPGEHQAMLAAAGHYFVLREKSWQVRADALRRINRATLRGADEMEDSALRLLADTAPPERPQEQPQE